MKSPNNLVDKARREKKWANAMRRSCGGNFDGFNASLGSLVDALRKSRSGRNRRWWWHAWKHSDDGGFEY